MTGAEGQNRTADTGIFSPLLYRLSYLGVHPFEPIFFRRGLILCQELFGFRLGLRRGTEGPYRLQRRPFPP